MFEILYADDVSEELQRLHARDRAIIVDRIKKQLRYEPAKATRAKKLEAVSKPVVAGLCEAGHAANWPGSQTPATVLKPVLISGLKSPWLVGQPVWQLRVGQHRVYYDVDENLQQVMVRAIRRKPPHTTTKQIL